MKQINLTFLYWDSTRASSYINALLKHGLYPKDIIVLAKENNINESFLKENLKFNYLNDFFDITLDYKCFSKYSNITYLKTKDINSNEVINSLKKSSSDYILFSGGGIIKNEILSISKKFIHIHPGIFPDFRGSTCFYYSLIKNNSLGASAFFMESTLDTGDLIYDLSFDINYYIKDDQNYFMDEILDPYIRMQVFEKILVLLNKDTALTSKKQSFLNKPAYFVIHPLLRSLAVKNINKRFKQEESSKIYQVVKKAVI